MVLGKEAFEGTRDFTDLLTRRAGGRLWRELAMSTYPRKKFVPAQGQALGTARP
jgi:hypothetical protein